MKKIFYVTILIFMFFVNSPAEVRNYLGNVQAENGSSFLYKGSINTSDKLAVKKNTCYDKDGKVIIKERTEYLETTCEIISAHIQDLNSGKEEIIIDKGDAYLIKFKKNHQAEFEEKIIEKNGIIIHPTVLAMFMQQNMDAILYGGGTDVTLLLTNRLSTIDFRLVRKGTKTINDEQCYEVVLEPSSLIIKQFVDPIYFYVKKEDPSVLVKYEGIIAPSDPHGNAQEGHILFSFN